MSKGKKPVYVISLSPSIMDESNVKYSVISAIQRAMARIWLSDGEPSGAPPWLIDGMVKYIRTRMNSSAVCGGCREWAESRGVCREDDKDPKFVAGVLGYLEKRHKGFVQGLNRIMRDDRD
ncbi:hypothetical protein F3Y22_tig00000724pilonHSYRG00002 [Hibiscus syriacus]|uniref:Uncharacterized protein n=1 Tax=Hibiscus syriacus TaxID=106335 RepID=A0A6A3D5R1_HIBSY|nr:hypothetical protein F3Y22_tig00000724pilonHSYRG00002 [Hibiscus syriacus]